MNFRKLIKSKTINSAILIAGLGALETNISIIPPQYQGYVLIAVAMIMAGLRLVTTKPVSEK